eukprot:GHVL01013899.1.p1 GENE.GHVL01013899.1~~GHVL01013899.1.p1  ORF type:complete len:685 (-),score=91.14 GHVL01013899.1:1519-3573(-)
MTCIEVPLILNAASWQLCQNLQCLLKSLPYLEEVEVKQSDERWCLLLLQLTTPCKHPAFGQVVKGWTESICNVPFSYGDEKQSSRRQIVVPDVHQFQLFQHPDTGLGNDLLTHIIIVFLIHIELKVHSHVSGIIIINNLYEGEKAGERLDCAMNYISTILSVNCDMNKNSFKLNLLSHEHSLKVAVALERLFGLPMCPAWTSSCSSADTNAKKLISFGSFVHVDAINEIIESAVTAHLHGYFDEWLIQINDVPLWAFPINDASHISVGQFIPEIDDDMKTVDDIKTDKKQFMWPQPASQIGIETDFSKTVPQKFKSRRTRNKELCNNIKQITGNNTINTKSNDAWESSESCPQSQESGHYNRSLCPASFVGLHNEKNNNSAVTVSDSNEELDAVLRRSQIDINQNSDFETALRLSLQMQTNHDEGSRDTAMSKIELNYEMEFKEALRRSLQLEDDHDRDLEESLRFSKIYENDLYEELRLSQITSKTSVNNNINKISVLPENSNNSDEVEEKALADAIKLSRADKEMFDKEEEQLLLKLLDDFQHNHDTEDISDSMSSDSVSDTGPEWCTVSFKQKNKLSPWPSNLVTAAHEISIVIDGNNVGFARTNRSITADKCFDGLNVHKAVKYFNSRYALLTMFDPHHAQRIYNKSGSASLASRRRSQTAVSLLLVLTVKLFIQTCRQL